METTQRPVSLVEGWQGAWAIHNLRPAVVAIRDHGPLTLEEIAFVLRRKSLHSDLTSGHNNGPAWGATMLARAVLEDAADVVTFDGERYSVAPDVREVTSRWNGKTYRLLTADEEAAAADANRAERPVRHWNSDGHYRRYGGKFEHGLPHRKHSAEDIDDMAARITAFGWLPGARIVKDQNGVTIEGHLRSAALGSLGIDPDTGTDPRSGEPYVEIRGFDNDAARLLFALCANWADLKQPTKDAVSKAVLGETKRLTLGAVAELIVPVATRGGPPTVEYVPVPEDEPVPEPTGPFTLTKDYEEVLAVIDYGGAGGATYKEVERALGVGHGSVSANLSRLEDAGYVVRLEGQRRDGCDPYIRPGSHGAPVKRKRRRRSKSSGPVVHRLTPVKITLPDGSPIQLAAMDKAMVTLRSLVLASHRQAYDAPTLANRLEMAGFTTTQNGGGGGTGSAIWAKRQDLVAFFTATKLWPDCRARFLEVLAMMQTCEPV